MLGCLLVDLLVLVLVLACQSFVVAVGIVLVFVLALAHLLCLTALALRVVLVFGGISGLFVDLVVRTGVFVCLSYSLA